MAHGNEVRRLLGSHHTGDLGDSQHVTLRDLSSLNLFKGFRKKENSGLRSGETLRRVLGTDVDHPSSTRLVEMRKFFHFVR